jgi:hypothetical protein
MLSEAPGATRRNATDSCCLMTLNAVSLNAASLFPFSLRLTFRPTKWCVLLFGLFSYPVAMGEFQCLFCHRDFGTSKRGLAGHLPRCRKRIEFENDFSRRAPGLAPRSPLHEPQREVNAVSSPPFLWFPCFIALHRIHCLPMSSILLMLSIPLTRRAWLKKTYVSSYLDFLEKHPDTRSLDAARGSVCLFWSTHSLAKAISGPRHGAGRPCSSSTYAEAPP